MAINFSITNENSLIRVKASGKDDNLEQVKDYGMAIIEAAVLSASKAIICDERELEYTLNTFDTFESAKFISENAPTVAKVALVCNPKCIDDAIFWQTVASNRGLFVKVFETINEAEAWIFS
jgi:hypothetical protein